MGYWEDRLIRQHDAIEEKTQADIDKQLREYYSSAMKRTISDFEATYEKILNSVADGKEPTPADLYNLDKYWQMQAQLKDEMQKLGDKEAAILSENFEKEWKNIYDSIPLKSDNAYSTISTANAKQMINNSWVADNKTFSERVWGNVSDLTETLNEQLLHCVITGKKTTELKNLLQERFNVSYNRANTLVRTETAHIRTQAAQQRYLDYGLEKYEFLGREEGPCGHSPDCHILNGKKFLLKKMKPGENAPPIHPNCRCCIIPVVDEEDKENMDLNLTKEEKQMLNKVKQYYPEEYKKRNDRRPISDLEHELYFAKIYPINEYVLDRIAKDTTRIGNRTPKQIKADLLKAYQDGKQITDEIKKLISDEKKISDIMLIYDYIYCADCGKPIPRNGRHTSAVKRCPDCQAEYRKKYKAQKGKERRKNKK